MQTRWSLRRFTAVLICAAGVAATVVLFYRPTGGAKQWDLERQTEYITPGSQITAVCLGGPDSTVLVGTNAGIVLQCRTGKGRTVRVTDIGEQIVAILRGVDDTRVFVVGQHIVREVRVSDYSVAVVRSVEVAPDPDLCCTATLGADSEYMWIGHMFPAPYNLTAWEMGTWTKVGGVAIGDYSVTTVAAASTPGQAVVGTRDGHVARVRVRNGVETDVEVVDPNKSSIRSLAILQSGDQVMVSRYGTNEIEVLGSGLGRIRTLGCGLPAAASLLVPLPRVPAVAGFQKGIVYIWDTVSWEVIYKGFWSDSDGSVVGCSRDGMRLVRVSGKGVVDLWTVR